MNRDDYGMTEIDRDNYSYMLQALHIHIMITCKKSLAFQYAVFQFSLY